MTKKRITVRLTPNQELVLKEMSDKLNAKMSIMIRAIIGDFLTRNEDVIESILSGERKFNINWMEDDEDADD